MLIVRFEQIHGERGNQRARKQIRRKHREHHRFGQRNEQIARDAGQEKHGQEHDADAQRRNQRGHRDLARAFQNGRNHFGALAQITVNIFDFDGRVVDQNSDRQRQTAQRHDVDRFAQRAQNA